MEEFLEKIYSSFPRWSIIVTGLLTLFLKLKTHFSRSKQKLDLKQDLEILGLAEKSNLPSKDLKKSIEDRLINLNSDESMLFNFLTGIFIFVFFGLWSINIYESNEGFSSWMGLTLFMSLVGLSMLFTDSKKVEKKEAFLNIELRDKANFQFASVIFLFTASVGILIFVRDDKINFWVILNLFFLLVSVRAILKSIRIIK